MADELCIESLVIVKADECRLEDVRLPNTLGETSYYRISIGRDD